MSLDYRYLFIAWLNHLSAFSCNDIAFTEVPPSFATGKNPAVFAKNGTWHEKETEMTNVRWKVFRFHAQNPTRKAKATTSLWQMLCHLGIGTAGG